MNKKFLMLALVFIPVLILGAEKVDINTATLAQLDALAGVGPVIAQRIIDTRPFSSINDLDRVKGIGPKTLQKIKDQGLACVNCRAPESPATSQNFEVANNAFSNQESATKPNINLNKPQEAISYPAGVFINEILPNPPAPADQNEWIEIYNSNNFEVDLSGWKIENAVGTVDAFIIPQGIKITPNGFLVFGRAETKIMLHDADEALNLFFPDGKITNSVSYKSAPKNQSYNRTNSGWQWSTALTPGAANIILADSKKEILPKAEKSANNIVEAKSLTAAVSLPEQTDKSQNPWILFFTVLAVAIISAAAVLFIKLKFKTDVRT